jgi:hypothetical protein
MVSQRRNQHGISNGEGDATSRLPEEEEETAPLTRMASFKRKLSEIWSSVAGI